MTYINPIEILSLSNAIDAFSINNDIIKREKRKLFADIDLSDNGVLEYYGMQITKGSCEKAIDELTNNDIKEYYLYLANNKPLNKFLATGEDSIFVNFKQDSIFKLPEFVKFISPYFAPKFDKALLVAFEKNNTDRTKAILYTSILIAQSDLNLAYKSVSSNIQNKIAEIDELTKDIKNEECSYDEDSIEEVVHLIQEYFPTETLNCLPQYFQSQILKIAVSINDLSNSIWSAFDTTQVPNDLTEYLLTLNIEGLDRPIFENNFKIINKKNNERIEQAKNAPLLKKWARVLLSIRDLIEKVESNSVKPYVAYIGINDLFDISELNHLPQFANEIRSQIARSIRNLSISMWNEQNDLKNALSTIRLALSIELDEDEKLQFKNDLNVLVGLQFKYRGVLICYFCGKNSPDDEGKISKTIYNVTGRGYRSVQYSYVQIDIPRCNSCQAVHMRGNRVFWFYLIIGIILGSIVQAIFSETFFVGAIIGGGVGWIIAKKMENRLCTMENINDASNSTLSHHPLLELKILQGWTFRKPFAY